MIEKAARIVRSPRRFNKVAFGADLNPVRDVARILSLRAKLREHRTYRMKVLLRLFVDKFTIHILLFYLDFKAG